MAIARPAASPSWTMPRRVLLGPGPSEVHPRVLAAMSLPPIGHLDPDFVALMDEMQGASEVCVSDSEPADDRRSRGRARPAWKRWW